MNAGAVTLLTSGAGPGRPATNRRTAPPTGPMKNSVPTWTANHRPRSSRRLPYMSPGSGAGWNTSSAAHASGIAAHHARISVLPRGDRGVAAPRLFEEQNHAVEVPALGELGEQIR